MKAELKELMAYSHHYNQKLITFLSANRKRIPERSVQLINHLLNAQQIWNARILRRKTFQVWQINPWEDLTEMDRNNFLNSIKIVEEMNLDELLTYSNSSGATFSNKIKDILFHIVNHSTYHRAQIAVDLRQSGIEPINTDYIFYKREAPGST